MPLWRHLYGGQPDNIRRVRETRCVSADTTDVPSSGLKWDASCGLLSLLTDLALRTTGRLGRHIDDDDPGFWSRVLGRVSASPGPTSREEWRELTEVMECVAAAAFPAIFHLPHDPSGPFPRFAPVTRPQFGSLKRALRGSAGSPEGNQQ